MGGVKRYIPVWHEFEDEHFNGHEARLVEHKDGIAVMYEDYAALERKLETVVKALKVTYEGLTTYQSGDEFDKKVQIVFAAIKAAEEREG